MAISTVHKFPLKYSLSLLINFSCWNLEEKQTLDDGSKECSLTIHTELKTFPNETKITDFIRRVQIIDYDQNDPNLQVINKTQEREFFELGK